MKYSNDIEHLLSHLGSELKGKREHLGLSQEELAERSGLHRTYITDIEQGKRNITLKSVSRLTDALQIPLAVLFTAIEKKISSGASSSAAKDKQKEFISPVDILLVEDTPSHVEFALDAIKKNNVTNEVFTVRSGEEALDFIFAKGAYTQRKNLPKPKLILLDITLPKLSGIEVLENIRREKESKDIPVIVLTASRSDEDYKECLKLGVTAFITKPIDFAEFHAVVPKAGFRWLLTV